MIVIKNGQREKKACESFYSSKEVDVFLKNAPNIHRQLCLTERLDLLVLRRKKSGKIIIHRTINF